MTYRRSTPVFPALPNTATTFDSIVECRGPVGTAGYSLTLPDSKKMEAIQRYNPQSGTYPVIYDLQDDIDGTTSLPAFSAGRTLICWGKGHTEEVHYCADKTAYTYWTDPDRIASGVGNSAVGDLTKNLVPVNSQHTKFIQVMQINNASTMADSARRV